MTRLSYAPRRSQMAVLVLAVSMVMVTGCGANNNGATGGTANTQTVVRTPPPTAQTTTPTPHRSPSVTHQTLSGSSRFRAQGRSWQACGTTVENEDTGYSLFGISVSGLGCTAGTRVMVALSAQVQRRQAAGADCWPGYCTSDRLEPTKVAGYHCTATDHGDVSPSLSIVCHSKGRYVSAAAIDES